MMNKIVRASLFIAAAYCIGSYVVDRPEEVRRDAEALKEIASRLPEPDAVVAKARETGEVADQAVSHAKQRLDDVRETVSSRIEAGADRFAGKD
jgi:chromosome condensin MukBEF ATPase and DNA-binding subunit MukB